MIRLFNGSVQVCLMWKVGVLVFVASLAGSVESNTRPIIGILAQETSPWNPYGRIYRSYLSAAYVKATEAAGGRAVPVFINKDVSYYEDLVTKLNGFIIPGGSSDITSNEGYARSGRIIYSLISKSNQNIPILAVCLGMELMGLITVGKDVRTYCPTENIALNLNFLPDFRNSSLYQDVSDKNIETLSKYNSTSNHHHFCITQDTLNNYSDTQWNILSTSNVDNYTFISSMELKSLPVVSLIFHPEKNAYEWNTDQENPHDERSIEAARIFYDWLLREARKNDNKYQNSTELMNDLIDNYRTIFTGKEMMYDYQDYYFK